MTRRPRGSGSETPAFGSFNVKEGPHIKGKKDVTISVRTVTLGHLNMVLKKAIGVGGL